MAYCTFQAIRLFLICLAPLTSYPWTKRTDCCSDFWLARPLQLSWSVPATPSCSMCRNVSEGSHRHKIHKIFYSVDSCRRCSASKDKCDIKVLIERGRMQLSLLWCCYVANEKHSRVRNELWFCSSVISWCRFRSSVWACKNVWHLFCSR